jgi:predicted amidohydrolase
MPPPIFRTALVQNRATPDSAATVAALFEQVRQAARSGAKLIALPEACEFLSGENGAFARHARPVAEHPAALAMQEAARESGAWILVGSLSCRADHGRLANRSVLISPQGEIRATYDKINLFDAHPDEKEKESLESRLYERGTQAVVVDIGPAVLGLTVCYDLRFPLLYRALARAGANILTVPSAFHPVTGAAHWHTLLRARAIETGCFVLAPAQCGVPHEGRENFGHSLIVNPWGEIVAEAGTQPEVIVADLDMGEVDAARRRVPSITQEYDFTVTRA